MSVFGNMAIKHKLTLITMLTCVISLVLAGVVFTAWEWNALCERMLKNLSTQAKMIADNCKAAMAFEDAEEAEKMLQILHIESSIVFGCIYNNDNRIFTAYYREDTDKSLAPSTNQKYGYDLDFDDGLLTVFESIILDGQTIGTVCLRSDLRPMYSILIHNTMTIIAALLIVTLVAYFVSSRLGGIISRPILNLAKFAKTVSEKKDYSTRVQQESNDEVGLLTGLLNEMLEQIQRRDSDLVETKAQLEAGVKKHTLELSSTNTRPEGEVKERTPGQDKLQQYVKQLNCLYGFNKLIERPQVSLEEIFQETAPLICKAYQHPELTCARITFDGVPYKTDNFEKREFSQYAEIKVYGDKAGGIEVYYLGEKDEGDESPFLKEERDFLDTIAEHLGRVAGRERTAQKLELFRNLIDRSNDFVFIAEPKWGRFLDVNDKACASLGYAREELLRMAVKDIDETIADDFSWQEYVKEIKLEGDIVRECWYRRKDATAFPAETSLKLVHQEKEDYIIAIGRDITERKQAEEKQAELLKDVESANQELTDFAHIVSHDLKAPLRGIKTLADWLLADYADKFDEEGKEQMELLLSRVRRMHNLIDGVLKYSRAGRVKEEQVRVNLNELVLEVIDMVAPPENISITIEEELPVIECEKTRIMQLFENLLSNAVKYMDKPQGVVKVGCIEEDGFWKFSVADNGKGIEEKHFERIFKMFQTLSPRDEYESTGVGLAVAKKIVELYGGKIWVESEISKGSTFFFTLPEKAVEVKDAKLEAHIAG